MGQGTAVDLWDLTSKGHAAHSFARGASSAAGGDQGSALGALPLCRGATDQLPAVTVSVAVFSEISLI